MNNLKKILNLLGVKPYEVYKSLGITPQAFNNYLNYPNPRKYNKPISNLLGFDESLLTKEELSEDDILSIATRGSKSNSMKNKIVHTFSSDVNLESRDFINELDALTGIELDSVSIEVIVEGIEMPICKFNFVKTYIEGKKIIFLSNDDETFSFENEHIVRIIKKRSDSNIRKYILVFSNAILKIELRIRED